MNQQRCEIIVVSNKAIDTIVTDHSEYILIISSSFFLVPNYMEWGVGVGKDQSY